MILSNVNIGTGPSAGDGDPLRSAFTIINNNFQLVTNNVNALTNSVNSVAGRTGNVILTVNDIVGLSSTYASQANINAANVGMRGYVDAKITANIALLVNLAPTSLDTIRELADAIGDDPNFAVNVALSVSSANTKMRGYVDGQITAANAGVTAANLGMKGYVDSIVGGSSNYSNVNAVSLITSLGLTNYSNVNIKAYTESMGFQNFGNANVASYLTTNNYATKSTVANLTNGSYTVSLDTNGNVTLPGGATIGRTASNTAIFTASTGGVLEIKSSANNNKLQVDDAMVSVMAADSHWHFDDNGKLTLPSGANITSYGAGVTTILDDNGVVIAQQVGSNAFSVTTATGVRVLAGGQIWTFNGNGSLSFPGGQIQTTAFNNTAPIITTLIANAATQSDLIIGINANITQANLGMKGYVDSVASQSIYGNANVASYLPTYSGNIDANIAKAGYIWSFGSDGNLTLPRQLFLPNGAVLKDTPGDGVSLGNGAGYNTQGDQSVAIGRESGETTQGARSVAVGVRAGQNSQGISAVAIGDTAGNISQGNYATAVGINAGRSNQGVNSTAIGNGAGETTQGIDTVAVGVAAGNDSQGNYATAVGVNAGQISQGVNSTAIGNGAGQTSQGLDAVAVGVAAGNGSQGLRAVSVGAEAGQTAQGNTAIAIGYKAGKTNQAANSIAINASLSMLYANVSGLYINPVRQDDSNVANVVYYNTTTKEMTYGQAAGSSYSNVQVATYLSTYSGNVQSLNITATTGANGPGQGALIVAGGASIAGNVMLSSYLHVEGNILVTGNLITRDYFQIGAAYNNVWTTEGAKIGEPTWNFGGMKIGGRLQVDQGADINRANITGSAISTSKSTGALTITGGGGIGVDGDIWATNINANTVTSYGDVTLGIDTSTTTIYGNVSIVTSPFGGNPSGTIQVSGNIIQDAGTTPYYINTTGNLIVGGNVSIGGTLSTAGNVTAGNTTVPGTSGKIGFNSGGFAQQTTSNATQVTSHFTSGNIQLMSIDLGASAAHTVPFSCNKLTTNDILVVKHVSGGLTSVYVDAYVQSDGLAIIWMRDITGNGTGAFTPMLKYAIIRAPSS